MNVVVHVKKFYDWEPLPDGVEPTNADIVALRVKPAFGGSNNKTGWLMRVSKDMKTYTSVNMPEAEVIAFGIGVWIREKRIMTRAETVAAYIQRHVMPHNFHRSWISGFETSDDGPDVETFKGYLMTHVEAGNIDNDDVSQLLEAYVKDAGAVGLSDDLENYFNVKRVD